jgi:hypothetical protein
MHFLGHPIVGDPLYTFKRQKPPPGVTSQLLHAAKLSLTLPSGKRKTFTAPLPADFSQILDNLSQDNSRQGRSNSKLGFRTPSSFKGKKH